MRKAAEKLKFEAGDKVWLNCQSDRIYHGGELFRIFGRGIWEVHSVLRVPEQDRDSAGCDCWVRIRGAMVRCGWMSGLYFEKA